MSAPGPANVIAAKALLAKVGLAEQDYTIDQLDMGQHVNAMTSGTFDAGYTLEPQASTMRKLGVARTIEAGVTKYILGDENGNAFAAGCVVTSDFIKVRPDVARRFGAVWKKGIEFVNENPQEARKYLAKNMLTPEDVVDTVRMVRYYMAGQLTDKHKPSSRNSSISPPRSVRCRRRSTSPITCRCIERCAIGQEMGSL
jgi:NitT/TauT family transport system substrate-binding protein